MADQGRSVLSAGTCDGDDAALSAWVDEAADQFEAAWQAVARPQIISFLGEATGQRRLALLTELVKLDVAFQLCDPPEHVADVGIRLPRGEQRFDFVTRQRRARLCGFGWRVALARVWLVGHGGAARR